MSMFTINTISGLSHDQFAQIMDRFAVVIHQGEQTMLALDDLKKATARVADAQTALAAAIAKQNTVAAADVETQVTALNVTAAALEADVVALAGPIVPPSPGPTPQP